MKKFIAWLRNTSTNKNLYTVTTVMTTDKPRKAVWKSVVGYRDNPIKTND